MGGEPENFDLKLTPTIFPSKNRCELHKTRYNSLFIWLVMYIINTFNNTEKNSNDQADPIKSFLSIRKERYSS